jgi:hypothetical protein
MYRKVIKLYISLVVLLLSYSNCKDSEKLTVSENSNRAFAVILQENDKVIEAIIKDSDKIPDLTTLISSIESGKSVVIEDGLKRALEEEGRILQDAKVMEKEAFYESISRFSEHLSTAMNTAGVNVEGYNRFYCPMVSKYWMAKGTDINNPFAPEMRDCGEIKN